jgi:hypothetical protein
VSSYPQSVDEGFDRSLVSQMSEPERVVILSLERSALTLEQYAQRLIEFAKSGPEVQRRTLASRRRALLRDAWGAVLKATLRNWLRPEVYESVVGASGDQADVSRNPAKDIWTELSVLYKRAPVRETDPPEAGDAYSALLAGSHFDLFWQRVELYVEAFNDCVVWPAVVERQGKKVIRHRIATPDMVSVKTRDDDPTEIEAVVIIDSMQDEGGQELTRYHFWTDAWYAVFDDGGEVDDDGAPVLKRADIGMEPGINPFGRLPFVAIHRDPVETDFWNTSAGEDLVCLTLLTGRNRTCDHYARKMSGFTQLMQWGDAPELPPVQLRSEGSILTFVTGGSGGVREVTWTANLNERADLNDRDIAAAAAARGINPEKLKTGHSYQNTTSARLSERGLSERREAKVETFVVAEQEYFRSVCLVAGKSGIAAPDSEAELNVEHSPLEYADDPLALSQYMREAIAIGVESPITIERRLHPTWSLKRCRESVLKKIEDTAAIMEIKVKRNVPDDPGGSGTLEDEENGAQGPVTRDAPSGSPAGKPQQQGEGVGERQE